MNHDRVLEESRQGEDHALRLLIYASAMKQASRRAALEQEVLQSVSEDAVSSIIKGRVAIGRAGGNFVQSAGGTEVVQSWLGAARDKVNNTIDSSRMCMKELTASKGEFVEKHQCRI